MSNRSILWANIIGAIATIAIPFVQLSAIAATKSELAKIAKSIIDPKRDRNFDARGEVEDKQNGSNLGIPIDCLASIASSLGVKLNSQAVILAQSQPLKAEDYFALANRKYKKGDKRGAIDDYDQAIALNPNLALAYNNRGFAKYDLGNNQAAIDDYNLALKINPNDAKVYNNRGLAKYTLGDNQAAINDYNLALKINPNLALPYSNRGLAKYALGDKQGGISDLTKASDLFRQQNRIDEYNKTMGLIKELQG